MYLTIYQLFNTVLQWSHILPELLTPDTPARPEHANGQTIRLEVRGKSAILNLQMLRANCQEELN